jgi:hypothetical protein
MNKMRNIKEHEKFRNSIEGINKSEMNKEKEK